MKFLFRVWDKEKERYFNDYELLRTSIGVSNGVVYYNDDYVSHKAELQQFTGFTTNDIEPIYVGDIIEFCDFASEKTGGYADSNVHRAIVRFENGSFVVENENYWDYLGQVVVNDSELKIVGNIYETNR